MPPLAIRHRKYVFNLYLCLTITWDFTFQYRKNWLIVRSEKVRDVLLLNVAN
jgi:hypothetical protein